MSMTDATEDDVLDYILGNVAVSFTPGGMHLALFTADPTDAYDNTLEVDESGSTVDTNYARQPLTFGASSGGSASTITTAQTFAAISGSGYVVTYFGIFDHLTNLTAGALIYSAALATPVTRVAGQTLVFDIGNITVTQS